MKHPTMSVERALQLFDSLVKPIVMFDFEVLGVGNCDEIDKYFVHHGRDATWSTTPRCCYGTDPLWSL